MIRLDDYMDEALDEAVTGTYEVPVELSLEIIAASPDSARKVAEQKIKMMGPKQFGRKLLFYQIKSPKLIKKSE